MRVRSLFVCFCYEMLAILVMTSADEILSLGFFFNMSMMIARSMGGFCSSMAAMICHRYI